MRHQGATALRDAPREPREPREPRKPPGRGDASRRVALAVLATAAAVGGVEVVVHGFGIGPPVSTTLILLTLTLVVYATFSAGVVAGVASALLVGLYAAHFVSGAGVLFRLDFDVLRGALIMSLIGLTMVAVVGMLRWQLERSSTELLAAERRHADALAASNRALREANSALSAFTFVVSHDLKEPVRAMEAYLRYLEEDHAARLPEEGRALLGKARSEAERLRDLLASLLDLSRVATTDFRAEPVDVADLVESGPCRASFDRLLSERGGRLDIARDIPRVLASPALLAQVLGNLVNNAIRHNPKPSPRVRVAGRRVADGVELVVEDDGPGFPPQLVARVDDLLEVPPSGRGGFGLIIAKRGVERVGGRLELGQSDLGGGRVRMVLPAAGDAADASNGPARGRSRTPERGATPEATRG